jgi:hypothetical protein
MDFDSNVNIKNYTVFWRELRFMHQIRPDSNPARSYNAGAVAET